METIADIKKTIADIKEDIDQLKAELLETPPGELYLAKTQLLLTLQKRLLNHEEWVAREPGPSSSGGGAGGGAAGTSYPGFQLLDVDVDFWLAAESVFGTAPTSKRVYIEDLGHALARRVLGAGTAEDLVPMQPLPPCAGDIY